MTPEQENEARHLIDAALGTGDQATETYERADRSAITFTEAANAYERGDVSAAAKTLEQHLASVDDPAQASYDLCAAGAIRTAALFADREPIGADPEYYAPGITMTGESDPFTTTALDVVNAAAARRADDLGERLLTVYRAHGPEGLQFLTTTLVHLHCGVRALVNDES